MGFILGSCVWLGLFLLYSSVPKSPCTLREYFGFPDSFSPYTLLAKLWLHKQWLCICSEHRTPKSWAVLWAHQAVNCDGESQFTSWFPPLAQVERGRGGQGSNLWVINTNSKLFPFCICWAAQVGQIQGLSTHLLRKGGSKAVLPHCTVTQTACAVV